jgi:CheY-like chemotaxis protein
MEVVHVLVVEDEELLHDILLDPLEEGGFRATVVLRGDEAISALEDQGETWGPLVTDIRLGRDQPTGWEVARRARELNPKIAVVYITGDSAQDFAANGVPNSLVLNKPFAPAQVLTAVAQLLNADNTLKP